MSNFKFRASACLFIISLMLVLSACATSEGGTATERGQSAAPQTTSTRDDAATRTYGRGGAILYDELGLHAPEEVEKAAFEKGWASISTEALPEMLGDADYLMLGIRGDGADQGKDILSKSVWKIRLL